MSEPERTPLRGELLEAVRAIAATLAADAGESEAGGRLPVAGEKRAFGIPILTTPRTSGHYSSGYGRQTKGKL